jgi:hypothetical protein
MSKPWDRCARSHCTWTRGDHVPVDWDHAFVEPHCAKVIDGEVCGEPRNEPPHGKMSGHPFVEPSARAPTSLFEFALTGGTMRETTSQSDDRCARGGCGVPWADHTKSPADDHAFVESSSRCAFAHQSGNVCGDPADNHHHSHAFVEPSPRAAEPVCAGPFVSAFDCPVHGPRLATPPSPPDDESAIQEIARQIANETPYGTSANVVALMAVRAGIEYARRGK